MNITSFSRSFTACAVLIASTLFVAGCGQDWEQATKDAEHTQDARPAPKLDDAPQAAPRSKRPLRRNQLRLPIPPRRRCPLLPPRRDHHPRCKTCRRKWKKCSPASECKGRATAAEFSPSRSPNISSSATGSPSKFRFLTKFSCGRLNTTTATPGTRRNTSKRFSNLAASHCPIFRQASSTTTTPRPAIYWSAQRRNSREPICAWRLVIRAWSLVVLIGRPQRINR